VSNPSLKSLIENLELRRAIQSHCVAIRAVVELLERGKTEAAAARLNGAVTVLHESLKAQCVEFAMDCPHCGESNGLEAWVDEHRCDSCGEHLDPEEPHAD
jgi:peptide subunit release factor 1 (eRF1)